MTLECDAKFEEKLTCGLENYMRNLANFQQSTKKSQILGLSLSPFIQSRKYMSLKLTGELCVMTMKNDAKSKKELTCQFKIDIRKLKHFDPSTQRSQKFSL